jgi:hypothetical protein
MAKLVLLSEVIALLAIPVIAARNRSARRGLQWTIILFFVYSLFYTVLLRYVWPRLL